MKPFKSVQEQARDYVKRVGVQEARQSNHFRIALLLCRCQTCFCCEVKKAVDELNDKYATH